MGLSGAGSELIAGKYKIIKEIGKGGFGVVYTAQNI